MLSCRYFCHRCYKSSIKVFMVYGCRYVLDRTHFCSHWCSFVLVLPYVAIVPLELTHLYVGDIPLEKKTFGPSQQGASFCGCSRLSIDCLFTFSVGRYHKSF